MAPDQLGYAIEHRCPWFVPRAVLFCPFYVVTPYSTTTPPVILAVFYDQANIPGPVWPITCGTSDGPRLRGRATASSRR
jgi:hypothetical protein